MVHVQFPMSAWSAGPPTHIPCAVINSGAAWGWRACLTVRHHGPVVSLEDILMDAASHIGAQIGAKYICDESGPVEREGRFG
jgi:hypothetical protein